MKAEFSTIIALKKAGYEFRINELDDSLEVNGVYCTDIMIATVRAELERQGIDVTADTLLNVHIPDYATRNAYNPIREYFDTLPRWDGQDHIGKLAAHFTDAHEPITYADGTVRTVIHAMLRRWLIGAVQRLNNSDTQNPVLVLAGKQGVGKSSFAKWICPKPEHFYRGAIESDELKMAMSMTQNFVWEIDELDATTRKRDISSLKASLTKGKIKYRPVYGRKQIEKPVTASFIATVNPDGNGFLRDLSGNRRFTSVDIESLDFDYVHLDKTQIWAQALHLYKSGETCTYTPEEKAVQTASNEEHTYIPVVDDYLQAAFILDPKATGWSLTSAEICEAVRQAGYNVDPKRIIDEAAQCLERRGHKKMGRPKTWRGLKHNAETKVITFQKKL